MARVSKFAIEYQQALIELLNAASPLIRDSEVTLRLRFRALNLETTREALNLIEEIKAEVAKAGF